MTLRPIQKVAVIGSGTMGSGIAQRIAQEDIQVVMVATRDRSIQKGMNNIKATLKEAIDRRILCEERSQKILKNIIGTTDLKLAKEANLVIEAVSEDENVKKDLFKRLDEICHKETIFASNTSSLSISDLAQSTRYRDRFIGMHFFYHPAKNRLIEIIKSKETSEEIVECCLKFSERIGKVAILVKDTPGFAVNRFFIAWLNEAIRMVEEGTNTATIEDVAKQAFGITMGPFCLMNVIGIPIVYHIASNLGKKAGHFYAPADLFSEQMRSGKPWEIKGSTDELIVDHIQRRLMGVVFFASTQLLEEGVVDIVDIDRGAKIGLRWNKGPFELMNGLGIKEVYNLVEEVASRYKLTIPPILKRQREQGKPWNIRYVHFVIRDHVAIITINKPESMNSLNPEMVDQLDEAFTQAENSSQVDIILIQGAGKTFVAGVDVGFFVDCVRKKAFDDIYLFLKRTQMLLSRIDNSSKLIIAKLNGPALGGGAELLLVADSIVATEEGQIGFPETGLGIYPALGGTQRLPRYIGKELAKYLIFTGTILDANTAQIMGLVEYIFSSVEIDKKLMELLTTSDIITKSCSKNISLPSDLEYVKSLFSDEKLTTLLTGRDLDIHDATAVELSKIIASKAPTAINLANQIIDEGTNMDIEKGLELELGHLKEVFSTDDAREGLTSFKTLRH